jgi:hypothetical protein
MAQEILENISFLQTFLAMFIMEEKGKKNVQGEVIFHRVARLGLQRLLTACGGPQEFLLRALPPAAAKLAAKKTQAARSSRGVRHSKS